MANPDDIVIYNNKSFDELLDEIEYAWRQFFKLKDLLPALFRKGREGGMTDDAIRTVITGRLGVPYRTMLRHIPPDTKRQYDRYHNEKSAKVAELPEPKIPPPEQPIIEQEPAPPIVEPEPLSPRREEVTIPIPLAQQLNKFLLAKMIGMAKSEGLDRITLKVNQQGEIYV